jgi:hypothetical protein
MTTQTKLSHDEWTIAFALYSLAREHSKKADAFAEMLGRRLGLESPRYGGNGHLTDAIYDRDSGDFETAMKREGFVKEDAASTGL